MDAKLHRLREMVDDQKSLQHEVLRKQRAQYHSGKMKLSEREALQKEIDITEAKIEVLSSMSDMVKRLQEEQ